MGNINDFIILVVIRQRVQERALFLCENLNNIYGEFPTSVDMKEPNSNVGSAGSEELWSYMG
jgi:hypothetical protein